MAADRGGAASAQRGHASIISPVADFMLVGGVSLIIIPLVMLPYWDVPERRRVLEFIAYCLIFVLNLPHFIHSYQLLYRGYWGKLTDAVYGAANKARLFIAGIAAPVLLVVFLVYGACQEDSRLLGYGTNVMLFTLGWHYVKQGYGIMISLSVRKKVFFDKAEKNLLLVNAYIVWLYSWFVLNTTSQTDLFHGVPYTTLGLPESWREPVMALFVAWTIGFAVVMIRKFDGHKILCLNGLAAYFFSVYPWVLFVFTHPSIVIFVPALHSLQYILFVWKLVYERTKAEMGVAAPAPRAVFRRMVLFLGVGFGAGTLFFILLPVALDSVVPYDREAFGPSLFVYCFLIFLNVHHYFADFAIWRKDNPEMTYLFR